MFDLASFYDQNSATEWRRLERHRTEFAVTLRAMRDFLPAPPAKILDIGGGPGRYTLALTGQGYDVTLLDLSAGNLAWARREAANADLQVRAFIQGNAVNLAKLPYPAYDAVLLLGPLYHLLALEARRQAVAEAVRILQPGGLLFAAFITRFAPLRDTAVKDPHWILKEPEQFKQIVETGVYPATPGGNPDFYFAHPDEITPFMETFPLETVQVIGVEGVVAGHEEKINALTGDAWSAWVDLNYRLGQEPALSGAADHLLYIGRKI